MISDLDAQAIGLHSARFFLIDRDPRTAKLVQAQKPGYGASATFLWKHPASHRSLACDTDNSLSRILVLSRLAHASVPMSSYFNNLLRCAATPALARNGCTD